MSATTIEIDPDAVYESIKTRYENSTATWNDFVKNNKIETISEIDSCILESKRNRFVVCNDPAGAGRSLKIPEKIAADLSGNPYFDNTITDADFPNIDKLLDNLSEKDKETVEKVKDFIDGYRNTEITLNLKVNCDWNGDPWNPQVNLDELDLDSRYLNEEMVEVRYNAQKKVLNTISEYKKILQKIANDLKISSVELNQYIMGWL
jgi:hypothetical protein